MAFENLKIYGSKLPNYDEEAKIFYGVVAQNSLNSEVVSDILFGSDTLDLSYEKALKDFIFQFESLTDDKDLTVFYDFIKEVLHIYKLRPSKYESDKIILNEVKNLIKLFKREEFDQIKEILIEEFNNHYECDNPDFEYKSDGYIIINCLSYDLMIIKSPFYTFAPECSPCVPCAGNIDDINPNRQYSKKTYCLGKDFYDEENEPTYKIYNVSDNKEVNLWIKLLKLWMI